MDHSLTEYVTREKVMLRLKWQNVVYSIRTIRVSILINLSIETFTMILFCSGRPRGYGSGALGLRPFYCMRARCAFPRSFSFRGGQKAP